MSLQTVELDADIACGGVSNPGMPQCSGGGVSQPIRVSAEMFTIEHPDQSSQPHTISLSSSLESIDWSMEQPLTSQLDQMTSSPKKSALLQAIRLPRKPSLPSLFGSSSSFRQSSTSLDLVTSNDAISNPNCNVLAPSLLLDDDPFASSSLVPSRTRSLLDMGCPPLSESAKPSLVELSPQVHVPQASSTRPKSSGHGRPAHMRPAFVPRPSLPSLHSLSEMNVVVPRKVRKGTVGARLPHEPWNLGLNSKFCGHSPTEVQHASTVSPSPISENEDDDLDRSNDNSDESVLRSGSESPAIDCTCRAHVEEIVSSRSLSLPTDADVDSLPSLSYTTSELSSSAPSRAPSLGTSPWSEVAQDPNSHTNKRAVDQKFPFDPDIRPQLEEVEEDPLSYHSDFDYYTQTLSDLSDFEPNVPVSQPQQEPFQSPVIARISDDSVNQEADLKPRTSADTMRSGLSELARTIGRPTPPLRKEEALHGGHEWRAQRGAHERHTSAADHRRPEEVMYGQEDSSSRYNGRLSNKAGGEGNGNYCPRDETGRPSSRAAPCYGSSSENEDGNTIYYSIDGKSNVPSRIHSRTQSHLSRTGGGSDDDVPLAQRMPTALKAQKSIRQQLRDERQRRKLERSKSSHYVPRPPLPSPPLLRSPVSLVPKSGTHETRKPSTSDATSSPPSSVKQQSSSTGHFQHPVEDLSRKLLHLQASPPSTLVDRDLAAPKKRIIRSATTSPTRGHRQDNTSYVPLSTARAPKAPPQDRSLKAAHSFHRPDWQPAESSRPSIDLPPVHNLGRSMTVSTRRQPEDIHGRVSLDTFGHSIRDGRSNTPTGHDHNLKSGRISEDNRRPSVSTSRPSVDRENNTSNPRAQRSLPAPAVASPHQPATTTKVPVVQQRIFIGDMQRFNTVELTSGTNAGDVIKLMASQGILDRSGSWMLFELAQDYGMERPIRDWEVLLDVSSSWDKDKLLNAFVIKHTPFAKLLSPSGMPSYSPTHRGWIEWESKRGKWSKRWMELREHGLWLSKRDTGKDEIFLCSVSNYDAYSVTRRYKSPRPFVFAVKSTDHLSLFENAADYLHMFSCLPTEGEKWMEAILVARSYVLHQEKNVLSTQAGESLSQAKPLSRSRTRKQSVSSRPVQPLISVLPPFSVSSTTNVVFEPGSLLAKRNGGLSL